MDTVEPFDEFDDDREGATGDIEREGRELAVDVAGESMRRMSRTSDEPRGVLGGGKGLVNEPARPRPDIKLRKRSRFLDLLAGGDDASSRTICLMRGRDATESIDQRDAKPVSPSAALPPAACLSTSPGVTVSASATTVATLIGDGSNVGEGIVASSAS